MDGASVASKICTRCHELKPLGEFHSIHKGGASLRPICKACGRAARQAWARANPEKTRAQDRRKDQRARERRAAARTQKLVAKPGHKICGTCRREKPLSEFWRLTGTADGKQGSCIACSKERNKRWREAHPNTSRDASRRNKKSLYGLTQEAIDAMAAAQGNRCAICAQPFGSEYRNRPCVDHNHETKVVRGILCHSCNMAIGALGDDPAMLEAAATYLRRGGVNDIPNRHCE